MVRKRSEKKKGGIKGRNSSYSLKITEIKEDRAEEMAGSGQCLTPTWKDLSLSTQ